jgi:[citrate (pro-3S)-lyase] ligase
MENTPFGISRYCRSLQPYRVEGKRIGAIVMNANPFTLGHRHLVEQAAHSCDHLHLFVVQEDASFSPSPTVWTWYGQGSLICRT